MAEGQIVVAVGKALPENRRDSLAPDLFDTVASEAVLSVPELMARVAIVSAFVLVVLVAANVVMLRVLS
ncbi:MAG TPA: hypothetical protein VL966_10790 [Alphaproteobacteria bacterium]|nr:hypothetical protein [Alphaproteobacteria bacterium]